MRMLLLRVLLALLAITLVVGLVGFGTVFEKRTTGEELRPIAAQHQVPLSSIQYPT